VTPFIVCLITIVTFAPKESPKKSSKFLSFLIKKKLIFPINILAKCISIKSIRPGDRISFTSSTKHFFKYQKNLRLALDQRRTINQNNAYTYISYKKVHFRRNIIVGMRAENIIIILQMLHYLSKTLKKYTEVVHVQKCNLM